MIIWSITCAFACPQFEWVAKGLASYCKAETTFTFYFSILTLSNAFLSINDIEMKSESGFSFAMASQPFEVRNKKKLNFVSSEEFVSTIIVV